MKFEVTANHNLRLLCEKGDKEELRDLLDTLGEPSFLSALLEYTGWTGNGRLYELQPEQIGALTSAPILTNELVSDDDGKIQSVGNVWWFPNYAVSSYAETLINEGTVVFTLSPEDRERKRIKEGEGPAMA